MQYYTIHTAFRPSVSRPVSRSAAKELLLRRGLYPGGSPQGLRWAVVALSPFCLDASLIFPSWGGSPIFLGWISHLPGVGLPSVASSSERRPTHLSRPEAESDKRQYEPAFERAACRFTNLAQAGTRIRGM